MAKKRKNNLSGRINTPNMIKLHRGSKNREKESLVVESARELWRKVFYSKKNRVLRIGG